MPDPSSGKNLLTTLVTDYIQKRKCKAFLSTKGQLISKCLFVSSILPNNDKNKLTLLLYGTSSQIIFACFLGELKTQ